mgnify:CR=1 FL=1
MKTLTKKIGTIILIGGLLGGLIGCTSTPKVEQSFMDESLKNLTTSFEAQKETLQAQLTSLEAQVAAGAQVQTELDVIKADLVKLQEQKVRDDEVLATYKELVAKVEAEQKETAAVTDDSDTDVTENLALGANLALVTLDNGDLDFLVDDEIKFNDEDYDVKERILLTGDLAVLTSLNGDEDFEDNAVLGFTNEGAIEYRYVFEDALNFTQITEDEPLVIEILGKKLTIIDMDANSFTLLNGEDHVLADNEKKTVQVNGVDHEIIVALITEGKVQLAVDGAVITVDEGKTKDVKGISVRATDIAYTGKDTQKSIVTLTIAAQDAELVVDNGDEFITDDENFEWVISTTGDNLNYLGVAHAEKADDNDEAVVRKGQTWSFAGLFNLLFDFEEKDYDAAEVKVSFDEATTADIPSVRFDSKDGKTLVVTTVNGDEEVETAYFDATSTVHYKDDNNDWQTGTALVIENDDLTYAVSYAGGLLSVGPMQLPVDANFNKFGAVADDAEVADLVVGAVNLGTRDHDVLLDDGTVVENPDSSLDDDTLTFHVPNDVVEAQIVVSK